MPIHRLLLHRLPFQHDRSTQEICFKLRFELRFSWNDHLIDRRSHVGLFQAINQGTTLQGDLAAIFKDLRVGTQFLNLHGKRELEVSRFDQARWISAYPFDMTG